MNTSKRKNRTGSVLANLAGRTLLVAAAFALLGAGTAQAGLTGFVTIGDPGNDPDGVGGYGAVNYTYQISATEVSIAEFTVSGAGDGDEDYWNSVGTDAPATYVTLYEAKKYANYLTEQANGDSSNYNLYSADGTGASGTYDRQDAINEGRLVYAIPTEDEWYKAAYYDASVGDGSSDNYSLYADGNDTAPTAGNTADDQWNYDNTIARVRDVGSFGLEQNGTRNMMGNVWEWQEDTGAVIRGSSYLSAGVDNLKSSTRVTGFFSATAEGDNIGFRVVAIPEPASGGLLVLVGGMVWFVRRRVRA